MMMNGAVNRAAPIIGANEGRVMNMSDDSGAGKPAIEGHVHAGLGMTYDSALSLAPTWRKILTLLLVVLS